MGMIIRGTTPTLTFNVKNEQLDLTDIAELWITFKSKPGVRLVEKNYTLEDVTVDDTEKTITLNLSQDDTLSFADNNMLVQIRLKLNSGLAYASEIIDTDIGHILKEGVI